MTSIQALPSLDGEPGIQYSLGTDRCAAGDVSITYELNSQGYRCEEFSHASLDSVWLIGCSFAQGIGVSVEHSLAAQLQNAIDQPVLNLAQGGTGIRWASDQVFTLLSQGLRPRALAMVWADTGRWPWVGSLGPHQPTMSQDLQNAHQACDVYMSRRAALDIASVRVTAELLGVPLAEITWSEHTAAAVPLPRHCRGEEHLFHYPERDRARDLQHPGPRSHKEAADRITRQFYRWQHWHNKTRKINARSKTH